MKPAGNGLLDELTLPHGVVNVTVTADFFSRLRMLAIEHVIDSDRLDWLERKCPALVDEVGNIGRTSAAGSDRLREAGFNLRNVIDNAVMREEATKRRLAGEAAP